MPVIPAPAGSAISSSKLVHRLVHQTSAERAATPVPILHASSYSAERPTQLACYCANICRSGTRRTAVMYDVHVAYDSFSAVCKLLARISDANDLVVPGRSSPFRSAVVHSRRMLHTSCTADTTMPRVPLIIPYVLNGQESNLQELLHIAKDPQSPQFNVVSLRTGLAWILKF